VIRKIRTEEARPGDVRRGTITLTNPGTIGTVHSIPRLMAGQAAILGVGAIDYPAEYQAADPRTLAKLGVGKVITLTSTYDHRVIQGAESGMYLPGPRAAARGGRLLRRGVLVARAALRAGPLADRHTDVDSETDLLTKQMKVGQLANMYRVRGHLIADLDPLRQRPPEMHPELDPTYYDLSIWDLDREFLTDVGGSTRAMPLGDILGVLRDAYCRTIGIEYGHVLDPEEKAWIRDQVEGVEEDVRRGPALDPRAAERRGGLRVLPAHQVRRAEAVRARGRRVADPLLDAVCEAAADSGVKDIVMGMAHRGRLNVLSNILGKSHRQIFGEFEGHIDPDTVQGSGDVKYHLGTRGTYESARATGRTAPAAEPVPPRGGQPGRRGHRPGHAGPLRPRRRGCLPRRCRC
jgi:multifunctional 2-oxoglutarate metabolism enzyme